VIEHLLSMCEALGSTPSTTKNPKNQKNEFTSERINSISK
jgi:hypothetical protein